MLFMPRWAQTIQSDLRPSKKSIDELEALRLQYAIPEDSLALRIMSSPATTIKVQKDTLYELKKRLPGQTDQHYYFKLLTARYSDKELQSVGITESTLNDRLDQLSNFDEYCKLVLSLDEKLDVRDPDSYGIGEQIDLILMREIE